MRYPDLPREKRLTAASLAGTVSRLAMGRDGHLPVAEKLEQIFQITEDPQILGHVLGPYWAQEHPTPGDLCAIALLRVAGADMAEAERNATWQRQQRERRAGGGFRL